MAKKISRAVIPAAGLGTRFLPATKAMPKEMLPIVDRPAIQYIVEEAVESGIEDILIITGRGKRAIEDHFDKVPELEKALREKNKSAELKTLEEIESLADIHYVRQKEALGLGHAVLCAKKHVGNEPFAVLLGDDLVLGETPCLKEMVSLHEKTGRSVVGVKKVSEAEIPGFGIIDFERNGDEMEILDFVEKPAIEDAPSEFAVLGRYILKPEIFGILECTPKTPDREIQLTEALRTLNKRDRILAYEVPGQWLTIGDKMNYLKAITEFALHRPDTREQFLSYLKSRVK